MGWCKYNEDRLRKEDEDSMRLTWAIIIGVAIFLVLVAYLALKWLGWI